MKTSSLFWGVFFISLGISVLLSNFGFVDFSNLSSNLFWPALLIIFGISMLSISEMWKRILASFSAVFLALIVMRIFSSGVSAVEEISEKVENKLSSVNTESYYSVEKHSDISKAILNFNGGAGSFEITDFDSENKYFKAKTYTESSKCNSSVNSDSALVIDFSYDQVTELKDLNFTNEAKILLDNRTEWDLHFNIGASDADFDLKNIPVKTLNLNMGASDFDLVLGNQSDSCTVNIKSGVSDINIRIPKESNCKIFTNSALSSFNFDGFEDKGNYYYSKSDNSGTAMIIINIEGGLADYNVSKY